MNDIRIIFSLMHRGFTACVRADILGFIITAILIYTTIINKYGQQFQIFRYYCNSHPDLKQQSSIINNNYKFSGTIVLFVCLILYIQSTIFQVFLGRTSTKLGQIRLAQGHNPVTPVRLHPTAAQSRVQHSTTEPLRSLGIIAKAIWIYTTIINNLRHK